MRIQLIHPQTDENFGGLELERNSKIQSLPCLGLIYLGSYAKQRVQGLDSKIFVESYTTKEMILEEMDDFDIVGVSTWFSNHNNALSFLKEAKKRGKTTVIGGPNTFGLARQLVLNNPYIDYVVKGSGEVPFVQLLEIINSGRKLNPIITSNKFNINDSPIVDLEDLVNKDFFLNIMDGYFSFMTTSAVRGCRKANERGRCIFCSLPEKGIHLMSPERYYQQIRILQEKYGFKKFLETGDDIAIPDYLDELLKQKPRDLEFDWYVQVSLEGLTSDTAKKLRQIGVRIALVGLETFDEQVMKNVNKRRENLDEQILRLLREGIKVRISVLHGLPGEDISSINRTYERLSRIYDDNKDDVAVRSRIVCIIPGTGLFSNCLNNNNLTKQYKKKTGKALEDDDKIDYFLLRDLYLENFTQLSTETIATEIRKYEKVLPIEIKGNYI